MGNPERPDGGEKLTGVPQRNAGSKGEHVHEQENCGRRPARRRKASYRVRLSWEYSLKTTSAARELPIGAQFAIPSARRA